MGDWKFRRRAGSCGPCGREFAEDEKHASTLAFQEGELVREDVCEPCWGERHGEPEPDADAGAPEEFFFWITRHRAERKRTLQLDMDSLEQLFLKLEDRDEEALRELRFVLCLLLMRKRRLKLEKVERDSSGEAMLVRRPRREALHRVYVFDFTPERMDEVRTRLMEIFEGLEAEGSANPVDPGGAEGQGAADGSEGAVDDDGERPADDSDAQAKSAPEDGALDPATVGA